MKPTTGGSWFDLSGQNRSNPRQYGTQKLPPVICQELLLGPSVRIRGPDCQGWKNSYQKVFVPLFVNSREVFQTHKSFLRNKSKIKRKSTTEILPSKTNYKKIQPDNYTEKTTLQKTQLKLKRKLKEFNQDQLKQNSTREFWWKDIFTKAQD